MIDLNKALHLVDLKKDDWSNAGTLWQKKWFRCYSRWLSNQLGVSTTKPSETALDMDRFEGVSQMGTLADDVKDVKPVKKCIRNNKHIIKNN